MSAFPKTKSAFAIVAAAVVALSVAVGRHSPPSRMVPLETRAVAQSPADNQIRIEPISNTDPDKDFDGWRRFQVTLPPHSPMLDMHMAFLTDNTGYESVMSRSSPWPQSFPIRYRLDTDDDSRVKIILEAQGLPTKNNVITYHFAMNCPGGGGGTYPTVTYENRESATQIEFGSHPTVNIGQKDVLEDGVKADSSLHSLPDISKLGSIKRIASLDALPPGKAHRFTVYVMFTPHQGPLRSELRGKDITRD